MFRLKRVLKVTHPLTNPIIEREQQQKDYVVIDKELISGLTEKEIQVEHLEAMIFALNTKIQKTNDLEIDVQRITEHITTSEKARGDLQEKIEESVKKANEANEMAKRFQDSLVEENKILGNTITERNQTIHAKDKQINELNNQVAQLEREKKEQAMQLFDLKQMKELNDMYKQHVNDAEKARVDL